MIKSIELIDFFSFNHSTVIKLRPGVNLLLGINGSGKSSFINALRVMTEGIVGEGLVNLIQGRWGGFDEVVNCAGNPSSQNATLKFTFDYKELNKIDPAVNFSSDVIYTIIILKSGHSFTLEERMETKNTKNQKKPFVYLSFKNGRGWISTRDDDGKIEKKTYSPDEIDGQELVLRQINDPVHYLPTFVLRRAIEKIAVYDPFNINSESSVRKPCEYSADVRLKKNGENLSLILNRLKTTQLKSFDLIEEMMKKVNPSFMALIIGNEYGKSYVTLREQNLERSIGASHLSDGTLKFLLLESIFYNPSRGAMVALEEPEQGLHPDMTRSVAQMIQHAAKESQLIIATHSPLLLNQFQLEDILVFEKDSENSTVVKKYTEDDFPDMDEYLPGQLWLMGKIGGKRW
ncbi:MAG: AAA family ATPase [Muribaculaceae bacterium]|nr:AAA family ATPase [Muribaculaceae bacterium]